MNVEQQLLAVHADIEAQVERQARRGDLGAEAKAIADQHIAAAQAMRALRPRSRPSAPPPRTPAQLGPLPPRPHTLTTAVRRALRIRDIPRLAALPARTHRLIRNLQQRAESRVLAQELHQWLKK